MAITASKCKKSSDTSSAAVTDAKPNRRQICLAAVDVANAWLIDRATRLSHPWEGIIGLPRKISDGSYYVGTNVLILLAGQDALGLTSPLWGSFKAIKDAGLKLERGCHCTVAVFGGFIERKTNAGDASSGPRNALDSSEPVAEVPVQPPVDDKASGSRRNAVPTLQPVQLFNVAQSEGFAPDPLAPLSPEQLAASRAHWLACGSAATEAFMRWLDDHSEADFGPEESVLLVRLATDWAVIRHTNEPSAIEAPLPDVPELGARIMKLCGVAHELSVVVEISVFGDSKAKPRPKSALPDAEEVDVCGESSLSDTGDQSCGEPHLTFLSDRSAPDALDAPADLPQWAGMWH